MGRLLFLLALLFAVLPLGAQYRQSRASLAQLPVVALPTQDNAALLRQERSRRRPGRPPEFAVSLEVDQRSQRDGQWTLRDDRAVWQLRVHSPGAHSLNLGFTDYRLPPSAELYLVNATQRYGPFTPTDRADRSRFWTPLLLGDELLIELVMPDASTEGAHLTLSTVNHDFAGALQQLSDACNIDVVCGAADGLPMIEDYRDIIRSVAAYTLEGVATCTGFLVNNTNQDGRPLFLTADHCRVTPENAPSLIAYWNFENSSCRAPGSPESAAQGDGRRDIVNVGARFLAGYAPTDMTLVEFEEPVHPEANAHFAGWDASGPPPQEGVVGIHHPQLDEKRISFSFQPTFASDAFGGDVEDVDFSYLRVPSWDLGTTQGGSSGSPLFDLDGRVRGQLLGGVASCDNDGFDIYGYLNRSWTGGGTPATRLQDWLDPSGGNLRILDGRDQATLADELIAVTRFATRCRSDSAVFSLRTGASFPAGSQLRLISPVGIQLQLPATTSGGEEFTLTYAGDATVAGGTYSIDVIATSPEVSDTLQLLLTLLTGTPPAPTPHLTNGAVVDPYATLNWTAGADTRNFDLQLATDADFATRTLDLTGLTTTSYTFVNALAGGTTYYWRVRARNVCGFGEWSAPRRFVTEARECVSRTAPALPLLLSPVDSNQVTADIQVLTGVPITSVEVQLGIEHTFTGDLSADLISPAGDTFQLFRPLQEGFCTGVNLNAVFSDTGSSSAEDFAGSCPSTPEGEYLSVRPLDPFAELIGTSARGNWRLVVTDRVPLDGGTVTDFRLRVCTQGADSRALTAGLASSSITACSNAGGSAQLRLGADFTDELSLRIETPRAPLDNYTFSFDPATGLLDVTFSAWTLVGPGTFPLSYVVSTADGTERRATHTLTVRPLPDVATDLHADVNRPAITFSWRARATSATLELSASEEFTELLYTETTTVDRLTVPLELLPNTFFWRVRTTTSCGEVESASIQANIDDLISVRDFPADRSFTLYPNPTSGPLTLDFRGNWSGERLSLSLYDAAGRQLRQWREVLPTQQPLGLDYPAGVYYLRVSGSSGARTQRLLLVP